jgi:hypothetical protein
MNWALVASMLLCSGAVFAGSKAEVIVKAQNKDDFAVVMQAVHQQMQPGHRYEHTTPKERNEIDARFADMQSMFDKHATVDQMNQEEKVQLFNEQEAINAILSNRDDDRLVCESVAPLGSHIPRTTCHTYREIMQSRHDTEQVMNKMKQVQELKGGGS